MKMSFGNLIRNKREEQKLQMNDFARQLGISPAYWSRIERNMEKPPKDALIYKACGILGIAPDDAFIEAGRLPPDMKEDVCNVIRIYREKRLAQGNQAD
jgi:HTH-type transcriptional regulator, competence development regulator